jgi:DNA-binding PadR family transcriptional regulator
MQKVEEISAGTVKIGPGTLYGALTTLEKEKLIQKVEEVDRRKIYQLTPDGRLVLQRQIERLRMMVNNAREIAPWLDRE